MPRPKRPPGEEFSASALIRMTPPQKVKLDLLGKGHAGGVAGLVRSWIDAQPTPGAKRAPTPLAAALTSPAHVPKVAAHRVEAETQLPLTRFVELDPNA